jgi:hypothetical protein
MRDLLVYCLGYSAQLVAYFFLLTDRYPYSGPSAYMPGADSAADPPAPKAWVLEAQREAGEMRVLTLVTHDERGELAGRRSVYVPATSVHEPLAIGQPVPDETLGVHAETALVAAPAEEQATHPVTISVADDLRRSRVLVLFRLPIAIPHIIWFILWSIVAWIAGLIGWLCAIVTGRLPRPFHRFLARWIRYTVHLYAFLGLVGNPFPGFVGKPGSYPVDLALPEPEPQKRLVTVFRFVLGFPAIIISIGVLGAMWTASFLAWFVALFVGRMPTGLQNLGSYALRYAGQANAYLYLLTARYPDSGPRADPASP